MPDKPTIKLRIGTPSTLAVSGVGGPATVGPTTSYQSSESQSVGFLVQKTGETNGWGAPPIVKTTAPQEIWFHSILESELDMLGNVKRDGLSEAFWAMVAGALAALPGAGEAVYDTYIEKTVPTLPPFHLFEVGLVLICTAIAVTIKIVSGRRSDEVGELIRRIKSRKITNI